MLHQEPVRLMHTHWLQDEALTVVKGRIGYQVYGERPEYAGEGETVNLKEARLIVSGMMVQKSLHVPAT